MYVTDLCMVVLLLVLYYSSCRSICHSHQTIAIVVVFDSELAVPQAVSLCLSILRVRTCSLGWKGDNRTQPYLILTYIGGVTPISVPPTSTAPTKTEIENSTVPDLIQAVGHPISNLILRTCSLGQRRGNQAEPYCNWSHIHRSTLIPTTPTSTTPTKTQIKTTAASSVFSFHLHLPPILRFDLLLLQPLQVTALEPLRLDPNWRSPGDFHFTHNFHSIFNQTWLSTGQLL